MAKNEVFTLKSFSLLAKDLQNKVKEISLFMFAIIWIFVSSPHQNWCWNPNVQVMVLGGGVSGRYLGHKDRPPPWMALVLLKRDLTELCSPFHHVKTQEVFNLKRALTWPCGHLDLGRLDSRIVRKKFLLFRSLPACYFVIAAWTD